MAPELEDLSFPPSANQNHPPSGAVTQEPRIKDQKISGWGWYGWTGDRWNLPSGRAV